MSDSHWKDRQAAVDRLLEALDQGGPVGEFSESAAPLSRELRPAVLAIAEMTPPPGEKRPDVRSMFARMLTALQAALDGDRLVRTGDRGAHTEPTAPVAREIRCLLDDLASLPEEGTKSASQRLAERIAAANSAA